MGRSGSATQRKLSYAAVAAKYARDVVAGKIPNCKWVILACARHLADLEKAKSKDCSYRFDASKAAAVCKFVELLRHIKGPKAGDFIVLEPWQVFILAVIFGWVWKATGLRRFTQAYIEVPRGNGKSALLAAVALYMLAVDGEGGAEVYSAATGIKQAKIVFAAAQEMARKCPEFCKRYGVMVGERAINQKGTASKFEPLTAEAETNDGWNVHCAVVDELHAHRTRKVYDVIKTACGKRDQPLLFIITTAGFNIAGVCYEVRTYTTKILEGVGDEDSEQFFGIIYTVDDDDPWDDEASWRKANPNYGVSVTEKYVRGEAAYARAMPSSQANFKTKHLNLWVSSDNPWVQLEDWDACAEPDLKIDRFRGMPCYEALDLAAVSDIVSRTRVFPVELDGAMHYYLFGWHYLPERAILDGRNSQYQGWSIQGHLIKTPGGSTDFARIRKDVIDGANGYQVRNIAFDPWQAAQLSSELMALGMKVVEYRNIPQHMSEPMKALEAAIIDGRVHHDGSPVMRWMISNVVCHLDGRDNVMPNKERPENKIDGVVSAIMAMGLAIGHQTAGIGLTEIIDFS